MSHIPCPKHDTCNAPVCPLDPDWQRHTTLTGEASCLFLREAMKGNGKVPEEMRQRIDEALPLILDGTAGGYALRKALTRAAESGSSRSERETRLHECP